MGHIQPTASFCMAHDLKKKKKVWKSQKKNIWEHVDLYEIQITVSINKVHWSTAMLVHSPTAHGYFQATRAKLNSPDKDQVPAKPNIISIWSFKSKFANLWSNEGPEQL